MNQSRSGVLVLDKPVGKTSREALDRLGQILPRLKMGHAGTLDPMACGVLVVCTGKATRLIPYVQRMRKQYAATMRLGQRSSTHDLEAPVEVVPFTGQIGLASVERCLSKFRGEIWQVPPQHSAVHVRGRRAYEMARKGETVELQPRCVSVERLACAGFEYPVVQLEVVCSSGTYVRSLVRDIGEDLGCGAVMTGLVRTAVGPFGLADALNIDGLNPQAVAARLLPSLAAVQELSAVPVPDNQLEHIAHGRAIEASLSAEPLTPAEEVALLDSAGELVAVAQLDPSGRLLRPHIVLIERSTGEQVSGEW